MEKTEIFTKIGFRARMRLTMILIIILVTAAGIGISIYLQNAEQVKALHRLGNYVAINLAHNSSLGVLSEEPENVKQALDAALGDSQIVGSTVYLSNGDVLDSRTRFSKHSYSQVELDKYMATLIATDSRTPLAIQSRTRDGKEIVYFRCAHVQMPLLIIELLRDINLLRKEIKNEKVGDHQK